MGAVIDGTSIDKVLRDAVESGAAPHVAAIAADRGGVIYEGSAGPRAVGERDPVTVDTLFRIMSMTKMPCTVAALQQVEQGNLDLDAPVAHYCPEFAGLQVLTGFDGDTPRLRRPARQATVKNLITHTSGLGYWFWSDQLVRWEKATGVPNVVAGSRASLTAPLLADPGEAFIYGINIDWLGKVVEAVTGVGLDVAIKQGVTGPLGMDQTTFLMNDDQRPNSTPVHVKGEDGSWVSIGEVLNQAPDYWAGGHGLYGPPSDYIRFERALLRGGELDGTRILQQSTVDAAFANQIGDLDFPADLPTADPASSCSFQVGPGFKFGYGLLLNPTDIPGMRRAWSGAWAGLCNTHFWVDRAAGICASIYSNFLPFVTPEAVQMYNDFESALYACL
ncbi:MAG TPA: serine hydrolase domain-containing protein [Streptosporangiaceae bacterium]|nr:serine hydrolase domain-containing protein [Streptosporangiaceae bacterium]